MKGEENNWISVKERLPEILEDGESEIVLVAGFKLNRFESPEYDLVRWTKIEKPDLRDPYGNPIEYGWSKRWWDTNPDYYAIHFWQSVSPPKEL